MAYVTLDKRVKPIVARLAFGQITAATARQLIGGLPRLHPVKPGYLGDPVKAFCDWEIDEAIKEAKSL